MTVSPGFASNQSVLALALDHISVALALQHRNVPSVTCLALALQRNLIVLVLGYEILNDAFEMNSIVDLLPRRSRYLVPSPAIL